MVHANLDPLSNPTNTVGAEAGRRANPGILVFTTSLRMLYINREAQTLCGQLNSKRADRVMNGVVPVEILEMCEAISKALSSSIKAKDWEHFQLKQTANGRDRQVLLRGLGIPDHGVFVKSRILILMEEVAQRKEIHAQRVRERFCLSNREQTAVIYLLKGLTNKEIASRMMICEQTVKEHIKHIMEKTKTTTRTGILSKILLSEPDQETGRPS